MLKALNLSMLLLFPVAWFVPLFKAGLLPFFELSEISIITGLQSLWAKDVALALIVTFLAIVAPYLKTIGMALIHFDLASPRLLPAISVMGKLAMADVFLIAMYIIAARGVGVGRIEVAWGLYLFTACVLTTLFISIRTKL